MVKRKGGVVLDGPEVDKVSKRVFTPEEERQFIYCIYDYIGVHGRADNGFRSGYVAELTNMLNKRFPDSPTPFVTKNINSKIVAWKREYAIISYLLGLSGIGWGDNSKQIICPNNVWEAAVRANKDCKNYRYKVWHFYEDWVMVFGRDRANGVRGEDTDAANEDGPDPYVPVAPPYVPAPPLRVELPQVPEQLPNAQPEIHAGLPEGDLGKKPLLYLLTENDINPKDYSSDYDSDCLDMWSPPRRSSLGEKYDGSSSGTTTTHVKYKAPRFIKKEGKETLILKKGVADEGDGSSSAKKDVEELRKEFAEKTQKKARLPTAKKVKEEDGILPAIKGFLEDAKANYMSLTPSFMKEADTREETRKKVMTALEQMSGFSDDDVLMVCFKIMENPSHLSMFLGCDTVRREKHAKLIKNGKI